MINEIIYIPWQMIHRLINSYREILTTNFYKVFWNELMLSWNLYNLADYSISLYHCKLGSLIQMLSVNLVDGNDDVDEYYNCGCLNLVRTY